MDKKEFVIRVYRYYKRSLNVAKGRVKDDYIAENIAQDVYEKLWIKRGDLGDDKQIKSYVYTTTINKCIDFQRAVTRTTSFLDAFVLVQPQTADEIFEPSDEYLLLLDIVADLPESVAMTFQLRGIEEYDYATIATILGTEVANVGVNLLRARKIIIEHMRKFKLYEGK